MPEIRTRIYAVINELIGIVEKGFHLNNNIIMPLLCGASCVEKKKKKVDRQIGNPTGRYTVFFTDDRQRIMPELCSAHIAAVYNTRIQNTDKQRSVSVERTHNLYDLHV